MCWREAEQALGSGFQVPLLSPEEPQRAETHKTPTSERKEQAIVTACVLVCHGNTLLPRSRAHTKGFCLVFLCLLADSSECWIQIHATRVEISHCSQAALHRYTKITHGFVSFSLQCSTLNSPKGTWISWALMKILHPEGAGESSNATPVQQKTPNATASLLHLLPGER